MDDEEPLLRLLERGLAGRHDVVTAGTCSEALAQLRDGRFDLLLLDVRMPDGGGGQVAEWLGRERPELIDRVVLMTGGVSGAPITVAGLSLPVLNKPFSLETLETLLESYTPQSPG